MYNVMHHNSITLAVMYNSHYICYKLDYALLLKLRHGRWYNTYVLIIKIPLAKGPSFQCYEKGHQCLHHWLHRHHIHHENGSSS